MSLVSSRLRRWLVPVAVTLFIAAVALPALADERYFTYSYEPKVLPKDALELEQWATMRNGKEEGYYTRWDLRTEFEAGLTDKLTTAIYMNWSNVWILNKTTDSNRAYFRGWSSEWKYKLTDPTADPVGVLVYGELGVDRREWEAEGKLILGKNIGNVVLAANAIFEVEGEAELEPSGEGETELELTSENTVGAAYRIGRCAVGLEGRTHTEIVEGEVEHTAIFLGPVLHANSEDWWATLTFLKQLTDVLDEHEKTETRLLFGIHL